MKRRRAPKFAVALCCLGAAAVVGGAFLPWFNLPRGVTVGSQGISGTPVGWETRLGLVALIAGGVAFALGLLLLTRRWRVALSLLAIAAGGAAVAAAVLVFRDPKGEYIAWAANKAATAKTSAHDIRLSLEALFKVTKFEGKAGVGAFGVMGAGGLVVLSGLAALIGRRAKAGPQPHASAPPVAEMTSTETEASPEAPSDLADKEAPKNLTARKPRSTTSKPKPAPRQRKPRAAESAMATQARPRTRAKAAQ